MSIGRSFQSASRYGNVLRSAWRSAGSSGLDSFMRSSLRVTGCLSSSSWSAQSAPQRPPFPVAQPSYGFAAQGIQLSLDSAGSFACTEGGGSGTTAVAVSSGTEDSECLANSDEEGVIPRRCLHDTSGPPWPALTPRSPNLPEQLESHSRSLHASGPWPLSSRPGAFAAPAFSSCTGVQFRPVTVGAAGAAHSRSRAFSTSAPAASAEPAFPNPSRPGHAAPAAHHRPAADGQRLSGAEYRAKHAIQVDDPNCPEPFQSFNEAGFPAGVMDVIKAQRYSAPSTIQAQAWPVAMAGRDVVAIASTGSGKTLGFLLPALMHIQKHGGDPAVGPSALVLAPTRELAVQIQTEADRFRDVPIESASSGSRDAAGSDQERHGRRQRHGGLRSVCLYGGASRGAQYQELRRRPHLIIATPGRLRDFIDSGDLDLSQVSYLVLDEADNMLDMGFEPQINAIAQALPRNRQTLFFSATWPSEVQSIAERFAKRRPVYIFIGDVQAKPVAATSITQRVQIVQGMEKFSALEAYLREQLQGGAGAGSEQRRVMVFCRTKAGCEHLSWTINNRLPFQAASIHGDKNQASRDFALQSFRAGRVPVLVATDVAARGLDIPRVTAVVNYDMPEDIEKYVHRIGRTGRAGASGASLALLTNADGRVARGLVGVLEGAGQEVPDELRSLASSGSSGGYRHGREGSSRGSGGKSYGSSSYGSSSYGRRDTWDGQFSSEKKGLKRERAW